MNKNEGYLNHNCKLILFIIFGFDLFLISNY